MGVFRPLLPLQQKIQQQQRQYYNLRNRVRTLPDLPDEMYVWICTGNMQSEGHVLRAADTPRLYYVFTQGTTIRRNRHHLQPVLEPPVIMTRLSTGTICRLPERLHYSQKWPWGCGIIVTLFERTAVELFIIVQHMGPLSFLLFLIIFESVLPAICDL